MAQGIHVFETSNFWRVRESSPNIITCWPFCYNFPTFGSEPEGITIWDLEREPSPHSGQLHVLLLDNDSANPPDDVFLRHYTHAISVNPEHPDAADFGLRPGHPLQPFKTVAAAADLAWDGAELRIESGNYSETVLISKRVRLVAVGGDVSLGR